MGVRFAPGRVLFGKYRVVRPLGRGGSGEVYLVLHQRLNVPRALKVLSRASGAGSQALERARERFRREAELGARFAGHPHIVQVYDFEEEPRDDLLGLVMEYMPGGSLKTLLEWRRRQGETGLPVEFVVRMARHVAQGLAALHGAGLVHRDVKPSNVLFTLPTPAIPWRDGNEGIPDPGSTPLLLAKIADLGVVQDPHAPTEHPEAGHLLRRHPGTPAYMSPEQAADETVLTPASDIYSLGATLFEALTGRPYRHLPPGTRAATLCPQIPLWLDDLLARMLAQDPRERPQDAQAFLDLLTSLAPEGNEEITLDDPSPPWPSQVRASGSLPTPMAPRCVAQERASGPEMGRRPWKPRLPGWLSAWNPRRLRLSFAALGRLGALGLVVILALVVFYGALKARRPHLWASPTPSPSPKVTLPVAQGTPYPVPLLPLEGTRVRDVTPLARWTTGPVNRLAWSPDGQRLAVAHALGVHLYDVRTGRPEGVLRHPGGVWGLAFGPDGTLVTGDEKGGIRGWRLEENGATLLFEEEEMGWIWDVALSPDGRRMAVAMDDGTVALWDLVQGQQLFAWTLSTRPLKLAFSPTGEGVAIGTEAGHLYLGHLENPQDLTRWEGLPSPLWALAFSPKGDVLVAGFQDGRLVWWEMPEGQRRHQVAGHGHWVRALAFTPDGRLLASAGEDASVRIWDVQGRLLHTLAGLGSGVRGMAFSPEGNLLATGTWKGLLTLWGLPMP